MRARLKRDQRACLARLTTRDTLLDLVTAVHEPLEPDQIAGAVVERAASWIPLTCWAVVVRDFQEQLSVLAASGPGAGHDQGPALQGVASWILRHHQPFVSGNLRADERIEADRAAAVIAWPIRGRDQALGALVGLDVHVSPAPPVVGVALGRALEELLRPAASALDSALLLKRSEALSVTDDLTRLYNARYLNVALRRETRLAMRNSRPLSLLFIDLDGFKSINDSHGHLAGSRALVEAGALIRGSARETDIVARFGGDEFALILPDTGSPGALAVAERIRERIARHSFLAAEGLDIHLTASVGAATVPDVAVTADELVQAADAAMYRVKDRGKNGIQAATSGR
ncbi:MAG TPA: GGDEF domain-containing protein [Vicinamibacterales bacterium]|nr:GGDEF domain-containing protein [Vicinamibacterales bacterium]